MPQVGEWVGGLLREIHKKINLILSLVAMPGKNDGEPPCRQLEEIKLWIIWKLILEKPPFTRRVVFSWGEMAGSLVEKHHFPFELPKD